MQNITNLQNLSSLAKKQKEPPFQELFSYITSLSNLVAYYPLDETSGNAINKAPATLGTLDGTITGATLGQPGKVGRAYSFDGVNDLITVADNNVLDFTGNMSVFAIVNPTTFGEGSLARMIDKGAVGGYVFAFNNTTSSFRLIRNNNLVEANAGSVTLESWQFLAAAYNGANVDYYKNGVAVGSPATTTNPTANTAPLIIGNSEATDRTFNGLMQHVALFNRALTAAEILKLARIAGFA